MKTEKPNIKVVTVVNASAKKVWEVWNEPSHITQWCQASEDWHAPHAENDLRVGGKFKTTMAAKDGSMRFDYEGAYTEVQQNKLIEYKINDGRRVEITFSEIDGKTKIEETFETETTHPADIQRDGWQAILESFRKHAESN